jgi:RNAse (barnase) inhibitor barstar
LDYNIFMATEYVIDGSRIMSLEAFYDEIGRVLIPGSQWGRNLDAFNDILRGSFGTPDGGFTLKWSHSAVSREKLGYPETVKQLEIRLERCHASNREDVRRMLSDARAGVGATVFDWLVQIIRDHCSGGEQAEAKIRLVLD